MTDAGLPYWPAEWEAHDAVWIGFPGDPAEWADHLQDAQKEVAAFANAVWASGKGERVLLICRTEGDAKRARQLIDPDIPIVEQHFGDIWLRDTASILTLAEQRRQWKAHKFRFNGWGGKFAMAGDQEIAEHLLKTLPAPQVTRMQHDWVLEGGAIDGDGQGRIITTQQAVLNNNRNIDMTRTKFASYLSKAFQVDMICWLGDGLAGDHTDGHVDNLARFVGPGKVAIPKADRADDPNITIFEDAALRAVSAGLDVVHVPSVGLYKNDDVILPASYLNFYIGNQVVVVPQYGAEQDEMALRIMGDIFPERNVAGLRSNALITGGGSFHCISQQVPSLLTGL